MTSLWPGGDCDPCQRDRHHRCVGWVKAGRDFCGCARGLCMLRLLTRVMWNVQDEPDGEGEP